MDKNTIFLEKGAFNCRNIKVISLLRFVSFKELPFGDACELSTSGLIRIFVCKLSESYVSGNSDQDKARGGWS